MRLAVRVPRQAVWKRQRLAVRVPRQAINAKELEESR